jgi:hypothetical protein
LVERLHLFFAPRRLEVDDVRAHVLERGAPPQRLLEPVRDVRREPAIRPAYDQDVAAVLPDLVARVERGAQARQRVWAVDDPDALRERAALGEHLVLDGDRREPRAVELEHGPANVRDAAEPGVAVAHHRHRARRSADVRARVQHVRERTRGPRRGRQDDSGRRRSRT